MRKISIVIAAELMVAAGCSRSLWPTVMELRRHRIVDLTQTFTPDSPRWSGFPPMRVRDLYTYQKNGFWAQEFSHVGQYGTHCDPPAHFHRGKRTVDQITPREMILPLVVIDISDRAAKDPDTVLTAQDVNRFEKRHGRIPSGAFVALRTDWSKRWPDPARMRNADERGVAHYPGWSLEALKMLYEQRGITASGHETTDTDPGISTSRDDYSCESYILGRDHYQIELMANLDRCPPTGAMIIVTWPKPKDGSGFPARALAIIP